MDNLEENKNKYLLKVEDILVITNLVQFVLIFFVTTYYIDTIDALLRYILMAISFIIFLFVAFYAIKIETEVGYYECAKCKCRYTPTYKNVLLAVHAGKTRYMKCPNCHLKSWQHKVLIK